MERQKQKRNVLLDALCILCILSGLIFDLYSDCVGLYDYDYDIWLYLHHFCRDIKLLGFSYFAYTFIPFGNIKFKTFFYMCIIWSSVIIAYNSLHTPINYETLTSILSLLYLWWLIRIATLKKSVYVPLELSGAEYNIMMPVNTWRGLAQTLFIPWRNPAYETHILVAHGKITAVVDGVFTQFVYDREHIRGLIKKGGVVRICNNYKKSYIDKLIGKNLILGLRDCRRLEC